MDSVDDGTSSEMSDADPQALLESLKGMDDLDAELFGEKKPVQKEKTTASNLKLNSTLSSTKKSSFGEKKRVSFHDSSVQDVKKDDHDDLDFDLDDPLKDLLSDDDSFQINEPVPKVEKEKKFTKKPAGKSSTKPMSTKAPLESEDVAFADDDNDVFDALGLDDDKQSPKQSKENDSLSRLDDLLSTRPVNKKSEEKPRKTLFDKDGNFMKDSFQAQQFSKPSPKPVEPKEVSFGGYQPSSTSTPSDRRQKPPLGTNRKTDNFFDFLTDADSSSVTPKVPTPAPGKPSNERSKSMEFLGLGDEVDLDSVLSDKPSLPRPTSTPSNRRPRKLETSFKGDDNDSVTSTEPPPTVGKPPRVRSSPIASPLVAPSSPVATTPSKLPFSKVPQHVSEANILDEIEPTNQRRPSRVSAHQQSRDDVFNQPRNERLPIQNFITTEDVRPGFNKPSPHQPPSSTSDSQLRSLESQLHHLRGLLHEAQLGFRSDLELTQQAYDGRVELLQRSLVEIQQRSEREIESIKESYAARLDAVREQSREHAREAAGRDLAEQDEIKRLREFHLRALEGTRNDYEMQMTRLKNFHAQEIDTIRNSSQILRSVTDTTEKLDSATQLLQQVTVKFDSAFQTMTQHCESMASGNSKIQSTIQAQLQAIQRSNIESHNSLQQTASKLESTTSEMNRRFEELQYQMQMEQKNLQVAQSSLENEKRQLVQQVALEREQARKAHNEAMMMQQTFQREAREEREKFARRDEEARIAARALEDARAAESERMSQRETERRIAAEELAKERAQLAGKAERLAVLETRLNLEKKDVERRIDGVAVSELELEERRKTVLAQERDVKTLQEKHSEKMTESSRALQEAKRIEAEHRIRLSDIHTKSEELARQRQLLAEERKLVVEDRLDTSRHVTQPVRTASPIPLHLRQYDITPVKLSAHPVTPVLPSPDANSVLWQHSADKDRDFLEDEEFFLETLKRSHYQEVQSP